MPKVKNVSERPYKIQYRTGIDKNTKKPQVKKFNFFPGAEVSLTQDELAECKKVDLFNALTVGRKLKRVVVEKKEGKDGAKFVRSVKTITERPDLLVTGDKSK